MSNLTKQQVAVSFIFKFPANGVARPKVALFKRSGKVSTYRHKYAPISGSVEATDSNPLATAWRELGEETGLDASSLTFLRQGKPYTFADESVGREWTIHPFAFVLKPPDAETGARGEQGMRLDWEHEAYGWFDPGDVADEEAFPGVPKLLESLRRVWPALDLGSAAAAVLDKGLQALRDDHESGARQLAGKAGAILADVVSQLDSGDGEAWWANFRRAAWHLWRNGRESMAASILSAVLRSLDVVERRMETAGCCLSGATVDDMLAEMRALRRTRETSVSRIASEFTALAAALAAGADALVVLTLSSSSTIHACLAHALATTGTPAPLLDLRVLESRPLFEGAGLACRLSGCAAARGTAGPPRLRTTVYTDACAAVAARDARLVLLGADLIDRHGNVSNKTGSLPAVLAAKHVSRDAKVVVVSETDKVSPLDHDPRARQEEENDPGEVVGAWAEAGLRWPERQEPGRGGGGGGVRVRNVYFEWVPRALVDYYVTEEGVAKAEDVMRWAEDVGRRSEHYFGDL
ncbi:uncharacterized protein UV8b_05291 [Ustilaginoidea virens]|uniref:Nudix hydrolase domain-containing protein n=1 Tax=Ustilaginoidea virens TaxID=1159556 RepID=A0A063C3J6_USTVR|nr:uncharacterized protein UV8b_05291 [Ustilaginoidea virens]QUC21050.1 hypothetical protein UV8b_05291 [Ustilaginoidea virens]GAO14641.1 hypothetical protein UVI_02009070 [Ustilaginoidea virens]